MQKSKFSTWVSTGMLVSSVLLLSITTPTLAQSRTPQTGLWNRPLAVQEDGHAGFACVAECQMRFAQDFAPYEACLEADIAQRREKIEHECIVYAEGSQERQECFRQVFQEGTDCRLETDLGSCVRGCVAARVWWRDRGQGK